FQASHEITAPQPPPSAPPPAAASVAPAPPAPPPAPPAQTAADTCPPRVRAVLASGIIRFRVARADILGEGTALLNRVADVLNDCRDVAFQVEGHTDSDGSPEANLDLSGRRAQAVVDYLVQRGIDRSKLTAVGFGETRPVAPNDTSANKALNRRIEINRKP
ncbi:MAG: OmpA family protein, partial [Alphaproteobacteria bacterium]